MAGLGAPQRHTGGALVTPGFSCALQQMDNAVYTFKTLLHQELGKGPTKEELCKSIQRILERVLKVTGCALGGMTPCTDEDTEALAGGGWSPLT